MTTPTVRIADVELPFLEYQGQPVVTFAMIDAAHKRPKATARKRFNDNKHHFIEGEDFYVPDSERLSEIRTTYPGLFPERTTRLTLFTETGYLMLVKSFTDDLAWQVQRQLVKGYFRAQVERRMPSTQPALPETIDHRQRQQIADAIHALFRNGVMENDVGSSQWLYNRIRVKYSLRRIEDLPAEHFPEVMDMISAQMPKVMELLQLVSNLKRSFYSDVIGNGEPWTPWIARHIGGKHKLPRDPDWPQLARLLLEEHGIKPTKH